MWRMRRSYLSIISQIPWHSQRIRTLRLLTLYYPMAVDYSKTLISKAVFQRRLQLKLSREKRFCTSATGEVMSRNCNSTKKMVSRKSGKVACDLVRSVGLMILWEAQIRYVNPYLKVVNPKMCTLTQPRTASAGKWVTQAVPRMS